MTWRQRKFLQVPTSSESSKNDVKKKKKKSVVGNLYDAFVCIRKLSNEEQARGLGGALQRQRSTARQPV